MLKFLFNKKLTPTAISIGVSAGCIVGYVAHRCLTFKKNQLKLTELSPNNYQVVRMPVEEMVQRAAGKVVGECQQRNSDSLTAKCRI